MSAHNTYYLWGFELLTTRKVEGGIFVGSDPADLERTYAEVELIGVHRCDYCMPWRAELPIYWAWGPRVPLLEIWPEVKHYE
jgi:hypothetical protein